MSARRALLLALALAACHHPREVSLAPLPRAAYAHYLAAEAALYADDATTAADELALAVQAAPDQPMIRVALARALVKAKRATEARAVLAEARAGWPDHAQVWLASGDVLAEAAPLEAAAAYRRAIALERDDDRAYLGLARVALAGDDARGAERTLRELVRRVPGSVEGHYRLAQRLAARGDIAGAAAELRVVVERDPDHIDGRLDLARALRRLGHLDEAIAQTRNAFERASDPLDVAEELFWLLCEADDRTAAIDLLTLLDDDRKDVEGLALVARLDTELGRLAEAHALADRIGQLDADAGAIVHARASLAGGDYEKAIGDVAAIGDGSNRYHDAVRVAIEAGLARGRDASPASRANLELLRAARAKFPQAVDLALLEAYAIADEGDAAAARRVLADLPTAAFARARLADRLGDSAGAIAALEPFVRAHPDDVAALNLLGYLLADSGARLDDAERVLVHARELEPGDPAILDSWGWLLVKRGRIHDAIRALDRANRYAPLEPDILVHLAAAWAADRAPRTAASVLGRAAALHPSRETRRRIDALRASLPP
jgi:predicted Zn-dependent protease